MSKRRFASKKKKKKILTKRQLQLHQLDIVTVGPGGVRSRNVCADLRKELHFRTHCAVSEFIIRYMFVSSSETNLLRISVSEKSERSRLRFTPILSSSIIRFGSCIIL